MFLAGLDAVLAYSLIAPLPYGLSAATVYRPFVAVMPLALWAVCWWTVSVVCAVAAVWHRVQPQAFSAAAMIKTVWAIAYLWGWLGGDLPRGYLQAVIWLAFAGLVVLVSGWQENPR
jgi:hypothetical protein